ncbi:hypothetical protein FSP39_014343 [Pinctada imbricata]|uniref:Uncharacterized protein n=1 Tax=Pinctada imbricata TaxID=66713 RepID=A0AA88YSC6_PINIB|nr:hypothetical protein FSP39_014343 [Pinctada imbricata]
MVEFWNCNHNKYLTLGHRLLADNLKNCHGQYTEDQVARCSKIVGSIGKAVEQVFATDFLCDSEHFSISKKATNHVSLKKFVELYKPHDLFETNDERRHHTRYDNFKNVIRLDRPEQFIKRMKKYMKKLQDEEYLLQQ